MSYGGRDWFRGHRSPHSLGETPTEAVILTALPRHSTYLFHYTYTYFSQ